ncbi:hypothetical protein SAVIM40S_07455 [Streptomyces avidinii]
MPKIDIEAYAKGVLDGKRAFIARAITLVESTLPAHRVLAQGLLTELLPHAGRARRIGISGVAGGGQVHLHRCLRHDADGARPPGGGARGGPLVDAHGRLHPG